MTSKLFIALTVTGLAFSACKSKQKTTTTDTKDIVNEPAITLDTIDVLANEKVEKEVYRASNPRLTDILHTRLDVNFDWANSRLNGKATLKLRPHFYPARMLYLNARGM